MMAGPPIRVLIAEDHPQTRLGLRECLHNFDDIDVVGEAATGDQGVDEALRLHPDVVIMDLYMHGFDGLEAIRRLAPDHPAIAILVLSMHHPDDLVHEVLEAGARGYLLKEADLDEVVGAIRATARGSAYYARPIDDKMRSWVSNRPREAFEGRVPAHKVKVLELLAKGRTNQEIAEQLCLALGTVQNIIWEMRKELECRDRTDLIRLCRREFGLDPETDPQADGTPGQPLVPAVACPRCRSALFRRDQ